MIKYIVLAAVLLCVLIYGYFHFQITSHVSKMTLSSLVEVNNFGTNPAKLKMFYYPQRKAKGPYPLVVAIHGCLQNAAEYAISTDWNKLADRYGFMVLYPEQNPHNNLMNCYNWMGKWWDKSNMQRGQGENGSIMQMVKYLQNKYPIDRSKIFVTGLSAGAVQTAIMLATWPDVFAGGAILAGVPFLCAEGLTKAMKCMKEGRQKRAKEWANLVQKGFKNHQGNYPKVAIWHGLKDEVVHPKNVSELVKQWGQIHFNRVPVPKSVKNGGIKRSVYCKNQKPVLESYEIDQMGHAIAVDPGEKIDQGGAANRFSQSVGIFSSYHIARFWGLIQFPKAEPDPCNH